MKEFEYNKNRDAHSTINGFVYQVNATIEKWINLNDKEQLELEKGEDIDIVQKEIVSNNNSIVETEKRILEQVKHRKDTIKLTNPEFIEVLINFKDHTERNPQIDLSLVYFTNSTVGKEQSGSPNNQKGVDVWNTIHLSASPIKDEQNLITFIKKTIIGSKPFTQPEKIKKFNVWKSYINTLSNQKIKELIKKIKINHTNEKAKNYSSKIINELVNKSLSNQSAELVYYNLFTFVFDKLTKSGDKILTKVDFENVINNSNQLINNSVSEKLKHFLYNNNFVEINDKLNEIDNKINILSKANDNSKIIDTNLLIENPKIAISFDFDDFDFVKDYVNLLFKSKVTLFTNSDILLKNAKDKSNVVFIKDINKLKEIDYCIVIVSESYHCKQWNKNGFCNVLKFSFENSKPIIPIKLGQNIRNIIGITSFVHNIIGKTNDIVKTVNDTINHINNLHKEKIEVKREYNISEILLLYSPSSIIVDNHPEIICAKYGYKLYEIKDEHDLRPAQKFLHIYKKSQLEEVFKSFSEKYKGTIQSKEFVILIPKEPEQTKPEIRLNKFASKFGVKTFYIDEFIWKVSKIDKTTPSKIKNYVEPYLVKTYNISTLAIFKNWLSSDNNPILFLTGIGGIGKTHLANKVSEIFCELSENSTVIFIKSEEIVHWLKSKERLDISVDLYEFYKAFEEKSSDKHKIPFEKFKINLDNGNILLVIDGLEEVSNRLENFNVKNFLNSIYQYANELKKRKVLITSRINYQEIADDDLLFETIELEHFNTELAEIYFDKYFDGNIHKIQKGLQIANELMNNEDKYVPFVLDIIQNIIDDENITRTTTLRSNILCKDINVDYIILNVLDREVIKTEQKLSIDQQVVIFIKIAKKQNNFTFNDLISVLSEIVSKPEIGFVKQKLLVHPLLKIENENIYFRYDFLYEHFKNIYLGEFLNGKIQLNETLSEILAEKIRFNQPATYDIVKRINKEEIELISYLIDIMEKINFEIENKEQKRKILSGIFTIALQVNHTILTKKEKDSNTELMKDMFGSNPVSGLSIINLNTMSKDKLVFDFSNLTFENCYFYAYENFWECKFDNTYFNQNCEFHYLTKDKYVKLKNISLSNFHADCYLDEITRNVFSENEEKEKADFDKKKEEFRKFCKLFHERHMVNRPIEYIRSKLPYSSNFAKLLEGKLIEKHPVIRTDYKIKDEYIEEIRKFCESGNPITNNIMKFVEIISL